MFLHLGGDVVVLKEDIIAIFDARAVSSPITREFMEISGDEGLIKNISGQKEVKSYILTTNEIYSSPISCITLSKRTKMPFSLDTF